MALGWLKDLIESCLPILSVFYVPMAIIFSMVVVGFYYPSWALPVFIIECFIAVYPEYRIIRKREKRSELGGCEAEDNKQFLNEKEQEEAIAFVAKSKKKSEESKG
jgi:hypothetical protein